MALKLGRLPAYSPEEKPRLLLKDYLRSLPTPPAKIDRATKVSNWPMYLNDTLGCCTCAAAAHEIQAWTTYGQSNDVQITDNDVLTAYEAVSGYDPTTGQNDNGAVVQDVLGYFRKTGFGGHKILAFAQVDFTNEEEVKEALDLFGSIYLGIQVPQSAMDQFQNGEPWTVSDPNSPIEGGHAIPIQYADSSGYKVVTWAQLQDMHSDFLQKYCEEAWVIITQDWVNAQGLDPEGLDLYMLGEDMSELTGEPNPIPNPGPTPPNPTPTPTPTPDSVWAEFKAYLETVIQDVKNWLASH